MDLQLKNKRVLIAGGSRGIGFAAAQKFQEEGAVVVIIGRQHDTVTAAAQQLNNCEHYICDLQDHAATQELIERMGEFDIVVNNAGAAPKTDSDKLTHELWEQGINQKLWTYINVLTPTVRYMAERGHGTVINVIGIGGKHYSHGHLPGGASNSALMMITAGYASEYANRGVRMVGVNPAGVDTDRFRESMQRIADFDGITYQEQMNRMLSRFPGGKLVSLATMANTIVFLASPCAESISGTTIQIDAARTPIV